MCREFSLIESGSSEPFFGNQGCIIVGARGKKNLKFVFRGEALDASCISGPCLG